MSVDGSGSSLDGGALFVGQNGATGSVTFSNSSTGSFGVINVDASSIVGTSGTLNVQSGAVVTGTGLAMGSSNVANSGTVTITGAGSALTLTGTATATIGTASASTATLDVLNGGAFTSVTGEVTLFPTSAINIDGGTVNLRGTLVRNGGVLNFNTGALSIVDNFTVGLGGLLGTAVTFDTARHSPPARW